MYQTDNIKTLTGVLSLRAVNPQGLTVWQWKSRNLIVNEGYTIAAQALAGHPGARVMQVAAGINATNPAPNDTFITSPCIVDYENVSYPVPGQVRYTFRFGYADAVGIKICEFGLLTVDGRLFSRITREPIEKTEEMAIVGIWEINFLTNE